MKENINSIICLSIKTVLSVIIAIFIMQGISFLIILENEQHIAIEFNLIYLRISSLIGLFFSSIYIWMKKDKPIKIRFVNQLKVVWIMIPITQSTLFIVYGFLYLYV